MTTPLRTATRPKLTKKVRDKVFRINITGLLREYGIPEDKLEEGAEYVMSILNISGTEAIKYYKDHV